MTVIDGNWQRNDRNTRTIDTFEPFSPVAWGANQPPKLDWMVENSFIRGSVAILSGDGGLGKSLLCQQLMTAAALGRPWLGMQTVQARSLAVFCEDDRDELHRRQSAINDYYRCRMEELGGVAIESRAGRDCVLMRFRQWGDDGALTPMFYQVRNAALEHKAQIVVLDTRSDVFAGNEVDRNQPRTFIRKLRQLALEIQGVIVLTEHPSVEGITTGTGRSGSTGWNNSVRSRLYLTRPKPAKGEDEPPENERVLRTMKSNYGKSGGKIRLEWRHGVFQPIEEHDEQPYWER